MKSNSTMSEVARAIKLQRENRRLTLRELASRSGISASHLWRIEQGKRSPSAETLQKIAEHLGFEKNELLVLAGFLSDQISHDASLEEKLRKYNRLDPYVVGILSQEPVEVQRCLLTILSFVRTLAGGTAQPHSPDPRK